MQRASIARGAAVCVAVGLALGACGGSGKSHTAASTATTAAAVSSTSTSTVASPAVVKTKTDPKLGTTIVTFGALPMYRFSKDKDDGDAYGEGLQSFGGTWHVVKTGAGASTTPTSSSGSGY